MKLLHISKPRRKSNFCDWEQSTEPLPSQLPPGFDRSLCSQGTEPARLILTPYPSYSVFQWWMPACRHFQQHPRAPHLYKLQQSISRKERSQQTDLQLPVSSEQSPQSFIPLHLRSA